MQKYKFTIRPLFAIFVEVDAENEEQAREMVTQKWCEQAINETDADNYDTIIEPAGFPYFFNPSYHIDSNGNVTEIS